MRHLISKVLAVEILMRAMPVIGLGGEGCLCSSCSTILHPLHLFVRVGGLFTQHVCSTESARLELASDARLAREKIVGAGIVKPPRRGERGDRFPLSLALNLSPHHIRARQLVDTHPTLFIRGVVGVIFLVNLDVDPLCRFAC